MRAVIQVQVKNGTRAKDIEIALKQPDVKAFAIAVGALTRLDDAAELGRALAFVQDYLAKPTAEKLRAPKAKASVEKGMRGRN